MIARWVTTATLVVFAMLTVAAAWLATTAAIALAPLDVASVAASLVALIAAAVLLRRSAGRRRLLLLTIAVVLCALAGWQAIARWGLVASETIAFRNGEVRLEGTLYSPRSGCPCPAAVLVHGSGAETRAGYAHYARELARRGVIALAYDKRGTGASGGELYEGGYEAYAGDARAAYRALAADERVEPGGVGFVGYSEAEWTIPLAAQSLRPAFVAIIGASGLSPAGQVEEEMNLRLRREGFGEADIAEARALLAAQARFERSGKGKRQLVLALRDAMEEPWFAAAETFWPPDQLGTASDYRWWRSVMDTQPLQVWRQVSAPVLFLKGERDDRSSALAAEQRLRAILPSAQFATFPDADHLLLVRRADWFAVPRFADGYFDRLAAFIHSATEQVRGERAVTDLRLRERRD